jgi:hypothetical protein
MNASAAAASRIDKWYALGLLMVVGLFNYIDRLCMSILQVPIKQELNLSDTQLGVLTGLAFSLLYTTMAVPIARLTPNLRALASATNVLMAGTFGATIGPFATGVFSDLIATNFALADDSLRYAIGLSSSFAASADSSSGARRSGFRRNSRVTGGVTMRSPENTSRSHVI